MVEPVATFFKTGMCISRAERDDAKGCTRPVGEVTTGELLVDAEADVDDVPDASAGSDIVIAFRTSGAMRKCRIFSTKTRSCKVSIWACLHLYVCSIN